MTQSAQPVPKDGAHDEDDYQAWRDLQDVLEERDREWWADAAPEDEPDETS